MRRGPISDETKANMRAAWDRRRAAKLAAQEETERTAMVGKTRAEIARETWDFTMASLGLKAYW